MASKKISVLGSGLVGEVLANGFLKHGYEVLRASREPEKLQSWKDTSGLKASIGTLQDGAKFGDIIVLVVKGTAAESAIEQAGLENLRGKVIIDATNPIEDTPPVNGVLSFFTGPNDSLMERLQRLAPEAHFVKAFSCVGSGFMVNPQFPGGPPTMFICGNNAQAKEVVKEILSQFGWETEDMGVVESARGIEPLCILWCNRGFSGNGWAHAFKLLKL